MSELRQEFEKLRDEEYVKFVEGCKNLEHNLVTTMCFTAGFNSAYALGQRDGAEKMREAAARECDGLTFAAPCKQAIAALKVEDVASLEDVVKEE